MEVEQAQTSLLKLWISLEKLNVLNISEKKVWKHTDCKSVMKNTHQTKIPVQKSQTKNTTEWASEQW